MQGKITPKSTEIQSKIDATTTEAINGLPIVTYGEQICLRRFKEEMEEFLTECREILIFIDNDVAKPSFNLTRAKIPNC